MEGWGEGGQDLKGREAGDNKYSITLQDTSFVGVLEMLHERKMGVFLDELTFL